MNKKTIALATAILAAIGAAAFANIQPETWTKVSGSSTNSPPHNHWDVFAVQKHGAPALGVRQVSTNSVLLYWPSPSTGYNLQVTTNMGQSPWATVNEPIQDDSTNKWIMISPAPGYWFYRLTNSR